MDDHSLAHAVGRIYRLIPNRMPGKRRFAKLCLQPLFRKVGCRSTVTLNSGSKFHCPLEDWIPWQIYLHGCYWAEREVEPILLDTARQSQVVFDVGAHMGYYTVQFAARTRGAVHSFEPNPRSFDCLQRNVALNAIENASLNNIGVSSQAGRLTLRVPDTGNSGSASFSQQYAADASDSVDVNVVTLADYCDSRQIRQVDMIKVDVEGHELEVLKGLDPLLDQHGVWRVFAEWNATTDSHSTYEELLHKFAGFGYVPWSISQGRIVPFSGEPSSLVLFEASEALTRKRAAA